MGDLAKRPAELTGLLHKKIRAKNRVLKQAGLDPLSPKKVIASMLEVRRRLLPMIADTRPIMWEALDAGKTILCEGAQGALLDIDHGTYPFVTSSSATAGGAAIGTGLPPTSFERVIGIFKAYCTRVGNGPFPSEDHGRAGEKLRQIGNEYGTTTGRPRRCGWFDAVAARTVVRLNGVTEIALTKMDVMDTFDSIKVCTSYKVGRKTIDYFPTDVDLLGKCRPNYAEFEGWKQSTAGSPGVLPAKASEYVRQLETLVGCRVRFVSTGPERGAILELPESKSSQTVSGDTDADSANIVT
jgi:adenylosuccinate synthase